MTRPSPYAYLCTDCHHMASAHLMVEGGELRAGPYRCLCGCEQPQDGHFTGLNRQQYERWRVQHSDGEASDGG